MRAFRGSSGESGGSFLPEDYVRNQNDKRANFLTVVLYVTVMSCVVAAFLFTNREWTEVREEQVRLQEEYVQQRVREDLLVKLEKTRREQIDRQAVVTALAEPSPRVLLLAELEKARPSDVEYTKLELESKRIKSSASENPNQGARVRSLSAAANVNQTNAQATEDRASVAPPKWTYTLTLEGVSPTNLSVADFIEGLRRSPAFSSVALVYIQDSKRDDVTLRKFEIEANLSEKSLRDAIANEYAAEEELEELELEISSSEDAPSDEAPIEEQAFAADEDASEPDAEERGWGAATADAADDQESESDDEQVVASADEGADS